MKLVFSEFPANYEEYSFPYQIWAIEANKDERDMMLNSGFLPSRMKAGMWYVARSLRIDLKKFSLSSENKRIIKNTEEIQFIVKKSSNINITKSDFEWMQEFAKNKFDSGEISTTSLQRIFRVLSSEVLVFKNAQEEIIGYVPLMVTSKSIFYWFAFYKDSNFITGLGTRMMLEAILWAQQNKLTYAYLGTVYSNSSLYKTNFKGFAFFNGILWSENKEELKYLIGKDADATNPQLMKDANFQGRFYESRDLTQFMKKIQS